jgi:hypothetical protein
MITHIDVGGVLRRNVCDLYSSLVTRPTGAAVRHGIEAQIAETNSSSLTIIDFGNVTLLDFSCADEVVAKLVLKYCAVDASPDAYFLFRGFSESHLFAIESVLERHGIAIVVLAKDGSATPIGRMSEEERRVWQTLSGRKRLSSSDVDAMQASGAGDFGPLLEQLHARRLLMRLEGEYVALGELLS